MRLGIGLGAPAQIAYAVPDAAAAAAEWADRWGAGPFFVRRHIELVDVMYRGRPSSFDHTSAYGQWGSVMVELVQDHGDQPSIVRERFAPDASGLHHLAFIVDDLVGVLRALADAGCELAMSARTVGGSEFNFVDTWATHGHVVELYQRSDRLTRWYDRVADAALGWDGRDPVRTI